MPVRRRDSAYVLAWLAFVTGTAFIILAVYLTSGSGVRGAEAWGRVSLSLGVALVAPTVLSVLHHYFETHTTLRHFGILRVHRTRSEISGPEWNDFIRDAKHTIWLYGITESGYAVDDETKTTLRRFFEKTRATDARVLLLNPDAPVTNRLAVQEDYKPSDTLANAIRDARSRFEAIRSELNTPAGFGIGLYDDYPQFSIVRCDSRMLVTLYVRYFRGDRCPTLLLRAEESPAEESSLFAIYEAHFERAWKDAHQAP
jgi:hypothetical protein